MSSYFSFLNIFRTNFNVKFKDKQTISTCTGWFLSFGVLTLLFIFAYQSDLFSHISPQVIDSAPALDRRPMVKFGKLKAIGVVNDVTLEKITFDDSLFQIKVIHYYYNMTNGTDYKESLIKLHFCSKNDFPGNSSLFETLNLTGYLCLPDIEFELEGYWDEPIMKYLSVQLRLCDNSTSNNTCKSYDEIKSKMNRKDFNLFYWDSVVDVRNYQDPIRNTFQSQWTYIDFNIKKDREYFFQNLKVETNDGFLLNNYNLKKDSEFSTQSRESLTVEDGDVSLPRVIFSFVAAKRERNITRSYQKISDLLASLGGTLNVMVLIGMIWIRFEHSFLIRKILMNEMYSFKLKKNIKKNKKIQAVLTSSNTKTKSGFFTDRNLLNDKFLDPGKIKINKTIFKSNESIIYKTQLNTLSKEIKHEQDVKHEQEIKYEQEIKLEEKFQLNSAKIPPKKLLEIEIMPESEKIIENSSASNRENIKEQNMSLSKKENPNILSSLKESEKKFKEKKKKIGFLGQDSSSKINDEKKKENIVNFNHFRNELMEKKVQMNICQFMKFKLKLIFKMKLSEEEEIINRSEKIIAKNLDYIEIIKKLQEIEKLKHIILDENQLRLFNFLSKPIIYLGDENEDKMQNSSLRIDLKNKIEEKNEKEELESLLPYFEKMKSEGKLSNIDKRLMKNLDIDIENFLKKVV